MTTRRTKSLFKRAAILALPLVLVPLLADSAGSPADLRIAINLVITVGLVLSIQAFSGNSGLVSFGHVAFMGVGAYTCALLTVPEPIKKIMLPALPGFLANAQLGLLSAVLVAALVSALVACVAGAVFTRMGEAAIPLATIGLLMIAFVVFDNWDAVTRGATGVFGIPQATTGPIAVGTTVGILVLSLLFRESNVGLKLRASSIDELAAESLGANVIRLRFLAWTLSGALMGAMGGVWAGYNLAFGPKQFFFATTFDLLAMLVVGGFTTVSGAVLGALLVTFAAELMRRTFGVPGLPQLTIAVLILVTLYLRPSGLVGGNEIDDGFRMWRQRRRALRAGRAAPEPVADPVMERTSSAP